MSQVNPVPAKKGGCMGNLFKIVGAVVVGFIVLVIIVSIVNPSRSTKTTGTAVSVAPGKVAVSEPQSVTVVADPPTATPEWMAPSFNEICDNPYSKTEIQLEDSAKAMEGKKIVGWVGKVYDVKRGDNDTFVVQVDMKGGLFKSRQLVIAGLGADVSGFNVDQEVRIDGTIESVKLFAGSTCNPINIVDATVVPVG